MLARARPPTSIVAFGCGFVTVGALCAASRAPLVGRSLHDEWRFHVRLNLLELREHLPILRRGRQFPVDQMLGSLRVHVAHFPKVVLFIEARIHILELQLFLQFFQFFFQLLDFLGLRFLLAFKIGAF